MAFVNINSGLLEPVNFHPSPNFNERPQGTAIDTLIVHCISLPAGEFGGPWIDALFLNKLKGDEHPSFKELMGLHVSSHLVIRRDGEIIQYVPFHKRAWHAGVSRFDGRENCNDFSIGIELEGIDHIAYEPVQYNRLAEVINALLKSYPNITSERIVGHSDIAPGRKTDPGAAFDWTILRQKLLT